MLLQQLILLNFNLKTFNEKEKQTYITSRMLVLNLEARLRKTILL